MAAAEAMMSTTPISPIRKIPRRRVAILIVRERDGEGWLALAGSHGWLFGSLEDARREAKWLSRNFAVPIRELCA
jgi:hypothetical protein